MNEQLWSDDLIIAEIGDMRLDENGSDYVAANEKVYYLMRQMRDEMQQRIEGLEAEVASLRSQKPGNDVLFAITMLAMMHDGSEHSRIIAAWLDGLEAHDD